MLVNLTWISARIDSYLDVDPSRAGVIHRLWI